MAADTWSLAEAKAKFSKGPQHATRSGKDAAVVVSAEEWDRRTRSAARSFVDALLDPAAGVLSREEVDTLFARDKDVGKPLGL
jgi:PHD/YefM family antitoxin component YafN of YafNO toxin-antitoxin module